MQLSDGCQRLGELPAADRRQASDRRVPVMSLLLQDPDLRRNFLPPNHDELSPKPRYEPFKLLGEWEGFILTHK